MKNLAELSVPQLAAEIEKLKSTQQYTKLQIQQIEAELLVRTSGEFIQEMSQREKSHGSLSKEIDGIKLTYEIKQSVSWDQEKLRNLFIELPVEIGSKLINTEYSVSESIFQNQVDPGIIDALIDARTTKLSAPSIKIK